jgi:hypothetical protein|tara:strand:- start:49 stop:231 length:183 start_codon:yes stop_codon:yes gene_type:complete
MKNQMTMTEIRRHFEERRKREAVRANLKRIGKAAAIAAEKRDRELVENALFCLKYGVNCA